MEDPDKPRPSIELDPEKAIERIKVLEASNHYLRWRYNDLHFSYRQREHELDQANNMIAQEYQRIVALEEAMNALEEENDLIASEKRMTDAEFRDWEERSKLADMIAKEVFPGWMAARDMRIRENSRQGMRSHSAIEVEERLKGSITRWDIKIYNQRPDRYLALDRNEKSPLKRKRVAEEAEGKINVCFTIRELTVM